MPLLSHGWIIRVEVLHEDTLVHQDEGKLTRLSVREKIIEGAALKLKLTDVERERFGEDFETRWRQFYARIMEESRAGSSQRDAASLLAGTPQETRLAAEELLQAPDLVDKVCAHLELLGIAGEVPLGLSLYVVGVSRFLDRPLSARIHGCSASGKSYIEELVSSLFPPEVALNATQLTPQALFHLPPGTLKHRLIVAGERSRRTDKGAADNTRALREMQASGRLTKLRVARSGHTEMVEQEGPIAFVESTTLEPSEIFDEDLTRCLCLRTDETPEQTGRILAQTASEFSGKLANADRDHIRDIHHAAQRMLLPYRVEVPFAKRLADVLDPAQIEVRRAFPQLLTTIQAVCLLHQYQRRDGNYLVATVEDYAIARKLVVGPLKRLLGGGLSEEALHLHRKLQATSGNAPFTTSDVCQWGWSRKAANEMLNQLRAVGSIELIVKGEGSRPSQWTLTGRDPCESDLLPSVESIARSLDPPERKAEIPLA
jgi:hypothetical protein